MNNLVIKEVEFNGDILMAAQSISSEKIYVGVNWVCRGIGFSKSLRDRQVKNVQEDIVLKQGCIKFDAGVFDENNETLAIELDFLPLWLAKISITPTMQRENPFIVQKLVDYQLKAKDILAEAFVKNNKPTNGLEFLQGMLDSMKQQQEELNFLKLEQKETKSKVVHIQDHLTKSPDRKTIERDINTYARRNNMKIQDVRMMIYNKIEDLHGIDIMQRVQNRRDKIQEEKIKRTGSPYAESTLNGKVNGMDIVAELNLMGEVMKILAGL